MQKLLEHALNRYGTDEMKSNPFGCVEAVGFFKACKIFMPELTQEIDKLINLYVVLAEISIKKDC